MSGVAPSGSRPRESSARRRVVPVIALGGMVGASGRHVIELLWPTPAGHFPWPTLVTNASGCLLIGMLMVQVVEVGGVHPLLRPFLGVGVLGGYTTFSTYAVQVRGLWSHDGVDASLVYLVGTPLLALVAVASGVLLARTLHRARTVIGHRKVRR